MLLFLIVHGNGIGGYLAVTFIGEIDYHYKV